MHTEPRLQASPDISVIITAHSEGRLAHRSVRSAQRAIRHAQQRGMTAQLIAVLDSPSPETVSYFERGRDAFDIVNKVNFRDLGLSRNHGVALAAGRYVAFLDADDLFSENWLAAAFDFASANNQQTLVLHPELNLYFGRDSFVFPHIDSTDPRYSPLTFITDNYWTALSFVARNFFLDGNQFPAADLNKGLGHEDWWWNCETIANGATHRTVPRTAHFIRQKTSGSLLQLRNQKHAVFPPTKFFEQLPTLLNGRVKKEPVKSLPNDASNHDGRTGHLRHFVGDPKREIKKIGLVMLGSQPRLKQLALDVLGATRRFRTPPAPRPTFPDWLIAEWRSIHEIEPELFPSREAIKKLTSWTPARVSAADRYPELSDLVGASPTHIYLTPWLKRGGSDLETIHFIRAVASETPGSRIACITTEDTESPWISQLPEGVKAVEFGRMFSGAGIADRAKILLRLLIQKKPTVIHNINSALGYELFKDSGHALSSQSRLFASIFCWDVSAEGQRTGYLFSHLPYCIKYLDKVLTDNQQIIDELVGIYGFSEEKFTAVYFPGPKELNGPKRRADDEVLRVLWASRPDKQKRPDVLVEIASRLIGQPVEFHMYGQPLSADVGHYIEGVEFVEKASKLSNIIMHGPYDGFRSLPTEEYDVFLYTAEWDGLPNVLLEAIGAGLPVIAPDVGGIGELVNEETGFLVSSTEAVDEYVRQLKNIMDDYHITVPKVEAATELICTRHSWASFISTLEQLPVYLHIDGYAAEEGAKDLVTERISGRC